MQTIRTFSNIAQAGLACSVLKAAGIYAALADENAFTMGPQYVPWGIRLQVSELDAEEAERVLDLREGFPPLTDDFIAPPEPSRESEAPTQQALNAFDAFLRSGMWTLVMFGMFVVVNLATGHPAHADPGRVLLLFVLGGIFGITIPGMLNKVRKDESAKSRGGSPETPSDGKSGEKVE